MLEAEEFYMEDSPIRFLGAIKSINLFIGANNTRKSRLIRNLISSKRKMLVSSNEPLNNLYFEGKELWSELFDQNNLPQNTQLVYFQGNTSRQPKPERFSGFREFVKYVDPVLTVATLEQCLRVIIESIITNGATANNTPLPDYIKRYYDMLDVLVFVYERETAGVNVSAYARTASWDEHNLNLVRFDIPDRDKRGNTHNREQKLHMCKSLRTYMTKLLTISFQTISPPTIYIPTLRSSRNLLDYGHDLAGREIFKFTVNFQYFGDRQHAAVYFRQ